MSRLPMAFFLTFACTTVAGAQTPKDTGIPPERMLRAYLHAEAAIHFEARRTAIAALKTPEDLTRRQEMLRTRFISSLGGFPEKTPLNPRLVGVERREGYRVERIIYESRPEHHVTANFYIPDGPPPFPGVLMPIGHSINGKAAEYIQRGAILLARNGLAVLTYDPIGQGERRQYLLEGGKPGFTSSTAEHTMIGVGALLVGRSTASYRIWDGIRSLDYLASRPEVDAKRLGCTGCSGGGTLTSYLMALDERIVAAAPSCYITSLERLFSTIGPQDAEQNIPGQVAFGMEHADYLTMRAPRPTLIAAATRDFFDIQGTWTSFREAKQLYALAGHGERIDLFESNTQHGFPKPQREAVLRFFRRWLLHKDDAPTEPDFPIAKDNDLWCTRTGQVLEEFRGRSAFHLNAARADELSRARVNTPIEERLKEIPRLLGLTLPVPAAKPYAGAVISAGKLSPRKLYFEIVPGITLSAWQFEVSDPQARPLVIYVHGEGKSKEIGPGGALERLVAQGRRVLALDLRGFGELAPSAPANGRPGPFGVDTHEAFVAQHLGRPLLGQRVHDLLAVIRALEGEVDVIGVGSAGPIALHAAYLEPRIRRLILERSITTWDRVVRSPESQNQLTNVVPGVLGFYDLPDLQKALGQRMGEVGEPDDALKPPQSLIR